MQKNVLKESIELMGIAEGDIVEVKDKINGFESYQYTNGEFLFINGTAQTKLSDKEIFNLLTGNEFKIIARAEKETVEEPTDEEYIDDCDCDDIEEDLNYIQCQVDYLLEKEEARTKNEEEKKKIAKWVDLGIIAFWGLALLLLLISNIF